MQHALGCDLMFVWCGAQMWKLKFADVDPKLKVSHMLDQVNQVLEANKMGISVQRLVPLWYVHLLHCVLDMVIAGLTYW